MTNDPLLQPFQLKHLTLKNRIMITSHEPAYPQDGMPGERYRAYHEERARGGVALTMTAGSAVVSRDSPPSFNNVLAYRDEVVPHLAALTDACHAHGCAVMIQLTHLGRRTGWNKGDWLPSISSTWHREPAHRAFPKLAEDWDIERIIQDYADAAERMQAAGMDGIELEAYGHLLDQFWSPLTNQLEGPYGAGSLRSRMQLSLDVLAAIRARVGTEFIVGVRMVADEAERGGIDPAQGLSIAHALHATGQVDFLNIIRGRVHTDIALTDVIPVQGMPSAPHLDFAGTLRREIGLPTFHAGRIPDVATARHAIANGRVDMVGMTRAHMAEPHIVEKISRGAEDDIRPCVGATYCLDRIYQGGEALCIHNAATGRELQMPHVITHAEHKKTVTIVGAGPGGMEAARVAGARGHRVHVLEAANEPGGQVRLAALSPRRKEMIGLIDWRYAQCGRHDVNFTFNTLADAADVKATDPDIVIVATGGMANTVLFETEQENSNVVSAWDIISRDVAATGRVLIFDESGDHPGLQAAEVAADTADSVEIMSRDRTFAAEVMGMNLVPYLRALQGPGVTFSVAERLLDVRRCGNALTATIGSDYHDRTREADYDVVVVNYGTRPLDELYFDLKPFAANRGRVDYRALIDGRAQPCLAGGADAFVLYRIGDAVSPRNTHAAIYDALRLVKNM